MAQGDGSFKVLAKVGANAYKLDLLGEMAIFATFNISDLSPYVEDEINSENLRVNHFKGGEDNVDQALVQDPQPEQGKGLINDHRQGLFYKGIQFHLEANIGRFLIYWTT